jgi:hypothetical protein
MMYPMTILKRILILTIGILTLAFLPLLAYAESNPSGDTGDTTGISETGETGDTSDTTDGVGDTTDGTAETPNGEQTTATEGAAGDAGNGAIEGDAIEGDPSDGTGEGVDQATEAIPEEEPPLSTRAFEEGWALVNLLASLLSIVLGVALVSSSTLRRFRNGQPSSDDQQLPQNFGLAVFSMLAAVISTVLFASTEDLGSHMIVADSFTVVHIALLAVAVLCTVLSLKKDIGNPIDEIK